MTIVKGKGIPTYKITTGDNGNTLVLGSGGQRAVGGWVVTILPDASWTGSALVVGRVGENQPAELDSVGYGLWPYRKFTLAGAVADGSIATVAVTLTASLITTIWIPASSSEVGLTITCSAGTAKMYATACNGTLTP